jgi:transposase
VLEAGCFAHARRKFFELADVDGAARKKSRGERAGIIYPIALEAVQRIDALFDIERAINGKHADERLAVRQELSAPLVTELHAWLTTQLAKLSRNHDLAKAINYMLRRWGAFTRFLDDGRVCLTNNAAERALRCVPLGRKAWLFCGSDRGGERAAVIYTLIQTAKLNDVDPQAWLTDVLARIAGHPAGRPMTCCPGTGKSTALTSPPDTRPPRPSPDDYDIQDRDGAADVLKAIRQRFPWLRHVFADGGYAGPKLRNAMASHGAWTIEIIKRSDTAKGFEILPRRWVIERTFAWLGRCRRLAKDWEASVSSSAAWALIASIRMVTRRTARYCYA